MNTKPIKKIFVRTLYIMVILVVVLSAAGSVSAQEELNPHFTVFPEWEFFDGLDWPDGATVTITVAGKPECATAKESWDYFFNGNFGEGCDIEYGDEVTFDDGTTTRMHTVKKLYVTDVDMESNKVSGKAEVEAGTIIYVWAHDGDFEPLQFVTAGSDEWQVDLDDVDYDIQEYSEGRSEIRDEMGNATASDWHVLHPHFTVFPEWEWFDGWDWPNEAEVTITVAGNDDCTTKKESWGYFFNGSFGEECDLEIGDEVTFTDGETTQIHTVQNLTVTKTNQEDDTIKGIADPGAEVYVWPHATGQEQLTIAKKKGATKGKWNADFSGIFDLVPGECGRSEIRDDYANSTAVDWCIPNPTFVAYVPGAVEGYEWPMGDEISLTINGALYPVTAYSEQRPEFPEGETRVLFEIWQEGWSLSTDDYVVMTDIDNGVTKDVTVTNLAVTNYNVAEGTVSGIYDPEYDLWVWLYDIDGQIPETDPDNGTWTATFTELPLGVWGAATQWDEDGDGTSMDFQVSGGQAGNFAVQWSQTNPEEVIYLSWKGSDNLTNSTGVLEFFGNSWVSENENTPEFFFASLVGWCTTGTWTGTNSEVNINSISSGCPGSADIPIHTNYQYFDDEQHANLIMVERTFEFGETPYAHDVRPFIPRLYPSDGFTWVIHPNEDGDELVADATCDYGCVAESWDGSWFAIHNPNTGLGMIVRSVSANTALWLDNDGASLTNSSSILLLQPAGGFINTVTETEYLCFYDSSWEPSLTSLPEGCQL